MTSKKWIVPMTRGGAACVPACADAVRSQRVTDHCVLPMASIRRVSTTTRKSHSGGGCYPRQGNDYTGILAIKAFAEHDVQLVNSDCQQSKGVDVRGIGTPIFHASAHRLKSFA